MAEARYVTVSAYAAAAGVHVVTVRRWIAQGLLPAKRHGRLGHYRIPRHTYDLLLKEDEG